MEDVIQLKKRNTLKFRIVTDDGVDTGEFIEFNLDDVELPLKLNRCQIEHKKNVNYVRNQFLIINKREDKKGKYLLSKNEEDKLNIIKEFYNREMKALDLFLGKDGTKKLLNGKEPYYEMYDDIAESLEPIMPKLELKAESIIDKIKSKYSNEKDDNILE